MRFRSRRLAGLAVAVVAMLGSACTSSPPTTTAEGGAGAERQFVVGYSQSNNAEPYRAQLNIQLQHFMRQYPELKLLPITDARQDSATQVSHVQQFISQKVDVLIVSPNEPAPLTAVVQQACDAGIPVIILDRSVNTDCYTSFIGGDNHLAGKKAGELALQLLPQGGSVVELQGILSNQPQIDRDRGFREAIAANPNIRIIAQREAKWLKEDATRVMQQWLAQYPKIDLVYAENDPMALGAYLAAKAAGREKQMKLIGTDGLAIPDGGIRAVQRGELAGTFIYPTCAEEAADTAAKIVRGEPVEKRQILDIVAVTPDNAAQLYQEHDFSNRA